ncbi:hypothetical protein [Collinsella sp. D33t1_170424_A12]|uniref:hypothetical protein n=1 Tax=Collinsella sp. D33t1_170424_A12 TaxID=2787135 RepID=UPI00189A5E61|nr:hypothetical protein [Collinsella sp. D33t1_170424_A12]
MSENNVKSISCPEMYDDGTAADFAAVVADAMTLDGSPIFESWYDRAYQAAHAFADDADESPSSAEALAALSELAWNIYAAARELDDLGGDSGLDYARELVEAVGDIWPNVKACMGL